MQYMLSISPRFEAERDGLLRRPSDGSPLQLVLGEYFTCSISTDDLAHKLTWAGC